MMSENNDHALIMSEVTRLVNNPDDTLPTRIQDTQEQIVARQVIGEQVKQRTKLRSLDGSVYSAYIPGKSAIYLHDKAGQLQEYEIDIRSIPGNIMEEIGKAHNDIVLKFPMIRVKSMVPKKYPDMHPMAGQDMMETVTDPETGETITRVMEEEVETVEQDWSSPLASQLRPQLVRAQNQMVMDKFLYGALIEIRDSTGKVVWDLAKDGTDGFKSDKAAAEAAIWKMGLRWPDIKRVSDDIDKISTQNAADELTENKKK
jgi:hypothetical protein